MRQIYHPKPELYKAYYSNQAQQNGRGLPVFHGARMQRGYGIGSFLKGLFRSAVPLLKQGARTVGKTALSSGLNIANDILGGQNLKSSALTRANEARDQLKSRAMNAVRSAVGQTGKGIKRRATSKSRSQTQAKRRRTTGATKPKKGKKKKKENTTAYYKKRKNQAKVRDIFEY